MSKFKLIHGDCLEVMRRIPDNSIDLILCDLPYATTACKWDVLIPFDELWAAYERIVKTRSAIVLFAAQPFTSALVMSNAPLFKYSLVWEKNRPSGVAHAKNRPMTSHEDILVFSLGSVSHESRSDRRMNYWPQGLIDCNMTKKNHKHEHTKAGGIGQRPSHKDSYKQENTGYPKSVLKYGCENNTVHPTQKPVALLEYLVRSFTQKGDLVLDNTMGSGSTGVACIKTDRRFIGIEKEQDYYDIAVNRIKSIPRKLFT